MRKTPNNSSCYKVTVGTRATLLRRSASAQSLQRTAQRRYTVGRIDPTDIVRLSAHQRHFRKPTAHTAVRVPWLAEP